MSVMPNSQFQPVQSLSGAVNTNNSLHTNLSNSLPVSINSVGSIGAQAVMTNVSNNIVSESQVLDKKRCVFFILLIT